MRRLPVAVLLALPLLLLVAGSVLAHARLVKSDPAAGTTLTTAPKEVVLWFNEELDTRQSTITVTNAAGVVVDLGNTKVNLDDRMQMSVGVRSPLANGVFLVRWHAVTPDDNGVSEGEFRFTLNAPAQATPSLVPGAPTSASATAAPPPPTPTPVPPTAAPSATPLPATATSALLVPTAAATAPPAAPTSTGAGSVDPAALLIGVSVQIGRASC